MSEGSLTVKRLVMIEGPLLTLLVLGGMAEASEELVGEGRRVKGGSVVVRLVTDMKGKGNLVEIMFIGAGEVPFFHPLDASCSASVSKSDQEAESPLTPEPR